MPTRDESFVPLTSATFPVNQRTDFHVTIVPQADSAQAFRPLGASAAGPSAPPSHAGCEPSVTVQREGDRVSSIQVQCGCGQIIELACLYETPPIKPA